MPPIASVDAIRRSAPDEPATGAKGLSAYRAAAGITCENPLIWLEELETTFRIAGAGLKWSVWPHAGACHFREEKYLPCDSL